MKIVLKEHNKIYSTYVDVLAVGCFWETYESGKMVEILNFYYLNHDEIVEKRIKLPINGAFEVLP